MSNRKLLLTGGSGFVGSTLLRLWAASPWEEWDELAVAQPSPDLRDAQAVLAWIDSVRPDGVLHLAAQSFVPASFENPRHTYEVNLLGTLNLLTALKKTGFSGRFLQVGTADAYGLVAESDLPVAETLALQPRNPYAVSKAACELLCRQMAISEGLDIVLARPFNHTGPGQPSRFAVSGFARQAAEIQRGHSPPVLKVGDLSVTRDISDVRDVLEAYRLLLARGETGEIYNVCSGREICLRDVLERILALAGVEAEIAVDASRLRPAEQRRIYGTAEKLKKATGWEQRHSLDVTLRDMIDYWKRELSR